MNEGNSPTTSTFQKDVVVKNGEVAKTVEAAKTEEADLIVEAICDPEGVKDISRPVRCIAPTGQADPPASSERAQARDGGQGI